MADWPGTIEADWPGTLLPPPKSEPQLLAEDAGRQLVKGAAKSIPYIYGLPGDIQELGYSGAEYATGKNADPIRALMGRLPTSSELEAKMVERHKDDVLGERPEAKTALGPYAEKVGEFALPSLIGPGGPVRKVLQYGVAGGLGSEAGRQLGENASWGGVGLEAPGAVLGAMVAPGLSRRVVTPFPTTAERTNAVRALQAEGVHPSAGDQTGSRGLRYTESILGDALFAPERARNVREEPLRQFTRAVWRRAGEDADHARPEVVDRAFRRLGGEFDRMSSTYDMTGDRQLVQDLFGQPGTGGPQGGAVTAYYNRVGPNNRSPLVSRNVDDLTNMLHQNRGHLTGEQYQVMRSNLTNEARTLLKNPSGSQDAALGFALTDIVDAMDGAMERSIQAANPQDAGRYREIRRQYRNLIPIAHAAAGGGEDAASGVLSPGRMRQAVVANEGTRAYSRGRGDFSDLVRAGNEVLSPLPNSGTAQRLHAADTIGAIGALMAGIPTYALMGPEHGVQNTLLGGYAGHAAGALSTPFISRAMFSTPGQSWLTNVRMPRGANEELAHRLATARALDEGFKPKQGSVPAPASAPSL